jgi:hypothetical protein
MKKDVLFSENLSIVVEVKRENSSSFQDMLEDKNVPFDKIGETNSSSKIIFDNYINTNVRSTKKVWKNSLRERLQ